MRPRQRVLDEFYPRSIRVVMVLQHGHIVPVAEDRFKKMREAEG